MTFNIIKILFCYIIIILFHFTKCLLMIF